MHRYIAFFLYLLATPLMAEEALIFKKELINTYHWFPYALILIVLMIVLAVLAVYLKRASIVNQQCIVVEKIALSHKTKIYVLDYQGHKFLLADNNNSLALQSIQEISSS